MVPLDMVNDPMSMLKVSLDIHRGSIDTVAYSQDMLTWPQRYVNTLQKHVYRL
jgi:hypothetical protein